ncbi:hypothetical protein E2542_SST19660 [Spatholobus suberectus]|nr:hypothetical protein E2542_SST19660 [Spatholobus suberectus]
MPAATANPSLLLCPSPQNPRRRHSRGRGENPGEVQIPPQLHPRSRSFQKSGPPLPRVQAPSPGRPGKHPQHILPLQIPHQHLLRRVRHAPARRAPRPLALLGFGAGTAARVLLDHYPDAVLHGWELDPAVVQVGREYFSLGRLEREHRQRLFIYVGNALNATVPNGFSGIVVDLFSKGSLIPELQEPATWEKLRGRLRKGGRIMVNVGGSCVEAENRLRDGKVVMEETLRAMREVFGEKLFVLSLGNRKDDSSLALTGDLPQLEDWKKRLPGPLKCYAHLWEPYSA